MANIYEPHEYGIAANVNTVDFLRDNGYELRREGNNYAVIIRDGAGEHDSLKVSIDGKKWNWFSRGLGGESPILLIHELEEIDKPYAIRKLADYAYGIGAATDINDKAKKNIKTVEKQNLKEFVLPERNRDNKRVFAYLSQTRLLDPDVINHCIDQGAIYESKKYHNAVFVGQKNDQGEVKHASLRGTYTSAEKPFKGDVSGSNKDYSFALEGVGNELKVFESAIDALSEATMSKMDGADWKAVHRVTLGGMSDKPLDLYLSRHPEIKKITLMLDNDIDGKDDKGNPRNHGQIRADNLIEKYEKQGYQVEKIIPITKDVNEDLKNKLSNAPIMTNSIQGKENNAIKQSGHSEIEIEDKNIADKLTAGVKGVFTSTEYLKFLKVMAKFHRYSANNCLLIKMQNPNATQVAGFHAWRKNFERTVKKGETGISILAPALYKTTITREEVDKETGEIVEKKTEVSKQYFKTVNVFDVSQTDGKELPKLVNELNFDVKNSKLFIDAIAKIASEKNIEFKLENIQGETKGYFSALKNIIAVKKGMSDAQTIKTAIHELAHAELHSDNSSDTARNKKEIEAESIAFIVAEHFGIDTSNYSFPYIATWSKDKEITDLKESLNIIRATSKKLIDDIEKELEPEIVVEKNNAKSTETKASANENKLENNVAVKNENVKEEFAEGGRIIEISNYENTINILSQNIPLYMKNENGFYRIESEKQIKQTTDITYLKSIDLDKNKKLIPHIYQEYLANLFCEAFNKNPIEALEKFNLNGLLTSNLNKAFLCNDVLVNRNLKTAKSLNDCIDIVGARLDVCNKIKSDVVVHIKESDKKEFTSGQILTFKEANEKIKSINNSHQCNKENLCDETKFILYVKNNKKILVGELRYDFNGDYKNLSDFIDKKVGGVVAEACEKELNNQNDISKKNNREEFVK